MIKNKELNKDYKLAVIQDRGKQYLVKPGQKIRIEKINQKEGEIIEFNNILLIADEENVEIGQPFVSGAKIQAKIIKQGRRPKITVLRYHSKTRYHKKRGHRQPFTEIQML